MAAVLFFPALFAFILQKQSQVQKCALKPEQKNINYAYGAEQTAPCAIPCAVAVVI